MSGLTPLRVRLFGPPRIEGSAGPLTGPAAQRHRLALLALLAGAPRHTLARDKLIGVLWPESDTASARQLLNVSVHALRTALGDGVLRSEADLLRLDPDAVGVDRIEFTRALAAGEAAAAVDLYEGAFLDGFSLPDAEAFEQWMELEREQLERAYQNALEQLAERSALRDERLAAVQWWQRRLSRTPADARIVQRTMDALARTGDRAGAIRLAQAHADLLERDLDARPDPEVAARAARLRQGDLTSAVVAGGAPARATSAAVLSAEAIPHQPGPERPRSLTARRVTSLGVLTLLGLLGLAALSMNRSRLEWARDRALPEARRLVERGDRFAAFRILREVEQLLPGDAQLEALLAEAVMPVDINSNPEGAEVYLRGFREPPDQWIHLGRTPVWRAQVPIEPVVYRIVHDSIGVLEALRVAPRRALFFGVRQSLKPPPGMVPVAGGDIAVFGKNQHRLDTFWIDQREATNAEYKRFVDAGGYRQPSLWTALAADAAPLSLNDVLGGFHDRDGRPGPSTWSGGRYPDGKADHPVGGISWYEAAAYCTWRGNVLPTLHHWYKAAELGHTLALARFGNFDGNGTTPTGQPLAIGHFGTYDMAGNVKEWTSTAVDAQRRYILGGGWNEPDYQFVEPDARRSEHRDETFGVRCARYRAELDPAVTAPVEFLKRDAHHERPVEADVFAEFLRLYDYDPLPLDARIESVDQRTREWRIERVSFTAAYGGERVPMALFLPTNAESPFQTIVFFPGAGAFAGKFAFEDAVGQRQHFLYIVRSGRAVAVPMYKGTYERWYPRVAATPHMERDFRISAAKDLRRSVDYLASRPDIDTAKIGYLGLSNGAVLGPLMTVIEPRLRVSVLVAGGLAPLAGLPEAEPLHFLPRVTVPTLMVNGSHDFFFPIEEAQRAAFRLLGSTIKKHTVLGTGHSLDPLQLRPLVVEWLDEHLGPVESVSRLDWRYWNAGSDTIPIR